MYLGVYVCMYFMWIICMHARMNSCTAIGVHFQLYFRSRFSIFILVVEEFSLGTHMCMHAFMCTFHVYACIHLCVSGLDIHSFLDFVLAVEEFSSGTYMCMHVCFHACISCDRMHVFQCIWVMKIMRTDENIGKCFSVHTYIHTYTPSQTPTEAGKTME